MKASDIQSDRAAYRKAAANFCRSVAGGCSPAEPPAAFSCLCFFTWFSASCRSRSALTKPGTQRIAISASAAGAGQAVGRVATSVADWARASRWPTRASGGAGEGEAAWCGGLPVAETRLREPP